MSLEVRLIGNGNSADPIIHKKKTHPAGLVVYTEPYLDAVAKTVPMLSETNGVNANINAAFSGTPDGIHNGTDTVLWTGSAISGTWDFASTTQAQAGTKSVDAIATVDNDEALFTRASTISTGDYTAITGFIYITAWPGSGTKEVTLRLRNGGINQGDELNLSNYMDTGTLGSWQAFAIPIEEFNAGTVDVDEFVVKTVDIGGGQAPNYYLDVLQFEEAGGDTFIIEPTPGTRFHITEITIVMADTTTDTSSTWNQILELAKLTNGINFILTTDNAIRFNGTFQQHVDFLTFPGMEASFDGNGTNASVQYTADLSAFPAVMSGKTKDNFRMIIADNLSGLLFFRVLVRGYEEIIK